MPKPYRHEPYQGDHSTEGTLRVLVPGSSELQTRWVVLLGRALAFVQGRPPGLSRLLATAFLLRSAVILIGRNEQVSDALVYDGLARGLASGGGYVWLGHPSAWWPIGYPALLSLAYVLFGQTPFTGQILNVVLGTITVGLVYALARTLDPGIALLAGWIMALLPSHVIAAALLTTETLCTTLFVLAIGLLWPPIRLRRAAAAGIACGALAMVRPSLLLFPAVWYGIVWVGFQRRGLLLPAATSLVVMMATLTPWAARNAMVLDGFALISTNGGFNLWIGNNPLASGNYLLSDGRHSFAAARRDPEIPWDREVEQNRVFKARSWEHIRSNPADTVRLALVKVRNLWSNDNDAVSWWLDGLSVDGNLRRVLYVAVHGLALSAYAAVLMAAAHVALVRGRRNRRLLLLLVPAVFITCLHALFHGDARFHFPAMPFLIILAACAFQSGAGHRLSGTAKDGVMSPVPPRRGREPSRNRPWDRPVDLERWYSGVTLGVARCRLRQTSSP